MNKRTILIAGSAALLGLVPIALPSNASFSQDSTQESQGPATTQQPEAPPMPPRPDLHDMIISMGDGNSWLGVETQEVNTQEVKELKLPAERGAMIAKVLPDSPAAKIGLKENDVVTEVNGQTVEGTVEFRRMIHEIPAGRKAQLTVWRDGRSQNFEVTLGNAEQAGRNWMGESPRVFSFRMPENVEIPNIPPMEWGGDLMLGMRPLLGVEVEDLEGQLGRYFGAPDGEGVLVESVKSGSAAEKAGIKAGDVIASLNGERIRTVGDLRAKLASVKDPKDVKVGILRDKAAMTVSVALPTPTARRTMRMMAMRTTI